MSNPANEDKRPSPDPAEDNAFFPSPYSLSQFTSPKSDLSNADYPNAYTGGRWKILMIGADERSDASIRQQFLPTATMGSMRGHPVQPALTPSNSTAPRKLSCDSHSFDNRVRDHDRRAGSRNLGLLSTCLKSLRAEMPM